jgi:hypothetical protein
MQWAVLYHGAFVQEFETLNETVQDALLAMVELLSANGPTLGRPHVDTLVGSRFANMKELRFYADNGVWRVAFAFDPGRQAIVLVAGDKSGVSQQRFYKQLIAKADSRFSEHLALLKGQDS